MIKIREQIIKEYLIFFKKNGRLPVIDDLGRGTLPNIEEVKNAFGKHSEAIQATERILLGSNNHSLKAYERYAKQLTLLYELVTFCQRHRRLPRRQEINHFTTFYSSMSVAFTDAQNAFPNLMAGVNIKNK